MGFETSKHSGSVAGGAPVQVADLPPADTRRWVASRKSVVVEAVRQGLLSTDEACARYDLSLEEFALWFEAVAKHGEKGLKVTAIQRLRDL